MVDDERAESEVARGKAGRRREALAERAEPAAAREPRSEREMCTAAWVRGA